MVFGKVLSLSTETTLVKGANQFKYFVDFQLGAVHFVQGVFHIGSGLLLVCTDATIGEALQIAL